MDSSHISPHRISRTLAASCDVATSIGGCSGEEPSSERYGTASASGVLPEKDASQRLVFDKQADRPESVTQ